MKRFKMALINSEDEIITTPRIVEAETIEDAREMYWDLIIGHEVVADEVSDEDFEECGGYDDTIEVPDEVMDRINTIKDLNDFYAYYERYEDKHYSYSEKYNEKMELLNLDINYKPGEYDSVNIARILNTNDNSL